MQQKKLRVIKENECTREKELDDWTASLSDSPVLPLYLVWSDLQLEETENLSSPAQHPARGLLQLLCQINPLTKQCWSCEAKCCPPGHENILKCSVKHTSKVLILSSSVNCGQQH